MLEQLFNVKFTIPLDIKNFLLKKKERIFTMYVEEYRHPDKDRAFSIFKVYKDKDDKQIKCEGMNFDDEGKATYCWYTLASKFENNILTYSYISFPYHGNEEIAPTVGQGSLKVFPSTKSFIVGDFTDDRSSRSIAFTVKRLTSYCNENKSSQLSPEDWQSIGKKVMQKIKLS
ncbi:hypothetical protein [Ferruginibacter albus]|uniref:hypothetical protein n=1 Tax=Ferruginibacter albus TaxID=2875540 RepID=UPI001CC6A7AB|nr:hypothetical protein [Ferruginibacter albus]UAY52885.1 hypothetical protein K9M53_04200 [Ferruginibacter albus]